jgi:hypothetical protein
MDKNWLIRTKSNHILGPVSKEKVLELYQNGSIKPDDEVCTGNGYWFFIREEELVEKFLLGSEVQGFNPISEAKDVLTSKNQSIEDTDSVSDVTLVGGINLSILNDEKKGNQIAPVPPVPDQKSEVPEFNSGPSQKEEISNSHQNQSSQNQDSKKKSKLKPRRVVTPPANRDQALKKQNWLKYVVIIGFILLLLMLYFRNRIIDKFLNSDSITSGVSLISNSFAQDLSPEKKKLLEENISLESVTFYPIIGLDGFKVVSSLEIENISCETLSQNLYQLGIILFPPDKINEKFLIKIRDCVVKLTSDHPLKQWIKWVAVPHSINSQEQNKFNLLNDLIYSHFNLITDPKVKEQITKMIKEVPENSLPEKILKSYLYLLIGNIARSDLLISEIITSPPRVNWEHTFKVEKSVFHKIALMKMEQILKKLSHHPADRKVVHLLILYFKSYFNDPSLLKLVDDIEITETLAKLDLKYVESLAPEIVNFARISRLSEKKRIAALRLLNRDLKEQAYWIWPFINIEPLISDELFPVLAELEKKDELWFIYLMQDEKLSDLFSKKAGKSFLPARRSFLNQGLLSRNSFMMSLYKLIEIGDINKELVDKAIKHLLDE